jgi:SAM-dependent methyltransferase
MLLGASDVYAVDYSAESLTVLQSSAGDLPLRGLLKADLQRLPFPDESFDCVLCANALQHLNRDGQRKSASEIMRVLRVGGHYSVSVHHFSREKRRAGWIKEGKPGQPGIDYIYRFDRSELRDLFPGASIRAVGFAGWTAQYFISTAFGQALARISLGHMLIASGRKLSIRPRRR